MKRVVLGLMLVVFLAVPALAQDFGQFGYDVRSRRTVNGLPTADLVDRDGNAVTVSLADGFGTRENSKLVEIIDTFTAIDGLVIQELRVVFQRGRADIVVVPRSFSVEGVALHTYMPSGMQFSYEDNLRFDFRLFVDELFVRVSGQYFGQGQFVERLLRAVDNPIAYIQSQDPQFLFRRLDEQQRLIEENRGENALQEERREKLADDLREEIDVAEQELSDEIDETRQDLRRDLSRTQQDLADTQEQTQADLAELEETLVEKIDVTESNLSEELAQTRSSLESEIARRTEEGRVAIDNLRAEGVAAEAAVQDRIDRTIQEALEIYRDSYATAVTAYNELSDRITQLRAEHEALLESHAQLRDEFDALSAKHDSVRGEFDASRIGAVTLYSRNLFGGLKPLEDAAVAAVVEAKTANPGMTVDETLEKFEEQYEVLHKKHVIAIFAIYFNEFPE